MNKNEVWVAFAVAYINGTASRGSTTDPIPMPGTAARYADHMLQEYENRVKDRSFAE